MAALQRCHGPFNNVNVSSLRRLRRRQDGQKSMPPPPSLVTKQVKTEGSGLSNLGFVGLTQRNRSDACEVPRAPQAGTSLINQQLGGIPFSPSPPLGVRAGMSCFLCNAQCCDIVRSLSVKSAMQQLPRIMSRLSNLLFSTVPGVHGPLQIQDGLGGNTGAKLRSVKLLHRSHFTSVRSAFNFVLLFTERSAFQPFHKWTERSSQHQGYLRLCLNFRASPKFAAPFY